MDSRYQPHLDHPAAERPFSPEARGLFVEGWCAARDEGWLVRPVDQHRCLVSVTTWQEIRELTACVRPQLLPQAPRWSPPVQHALPHVPA